MRKYIAILLLTACSIGINAQNVSKNPEFKKFSTGVTLYNDFWQGDYQNMKPRTINQGTDFFGMINIPMEKTRLVFSVGVGIGVHNLFSDAFLQKDTSNIYHFVKIKDQMTDGQEYKVNKFTVAYVDFPFEFRYKSNSGFKAALGMKFGFVLASHTKYKGDDCILGSDEVIKMKTSNIDNLEKWRYGVTGRIGYKAVELYAYYGLTKVFQKDEGPDLFPISIGVSLRPF